MLSRLVRPLGFLLSIICMILSLFFPVATMGDALRLLAVACMVTAGIGVAVLVWIGRMDVQEFERTFWKFAKYFTMFLIGALIAASIIFAVISLVR